MRADAWLGVRARTQHILREILALLKHVRRVLAIASEAAQVQVQR